MERHVRQLPVLGIFLGCLFLMATVLIIYYKQISEGYEDHDRFRIMQQGGHEPERGQTRHQQTDIAGVFLPLLMAALHMVFAFEIICNMLLVFGRVNRLLFFGCTAAHFSLSLPRMWWYTALPRVPITALWRRDASLLHFKTKG